MLNTKIHNAFLIGALALFFFSFSAFAQTSLQNKKVTLIVTCKDDSGNTLDKIVISVNNTNFPPTERGATRAVIDFKSPVKISTKDARFDISEDQKSFELDKVARKQYLVLTLVPRQSSAPMPTEGNKGDKTPPEIVWSMPPIIKDPSALLQFSITDENDIAKPTLKVEFLELVGDGKPKPVERSSIAIEETFNGEKIELLCEFRPKQQLVSNQKYAVSITVADVNGNKTEVSFNFLCRY